MLVRGLAILSRFVISCLSLEINGAGAKGFHSIAVLKCPAISRTTNRLAFGANVPRLGSDRPRQSLDLLEAFAICPEAGIAAGDVSLINRDGGQLTREDMVSYLPAESLDDMLALDVVRSYPIPRNPNYRPPQHDCLLHFSATSVYRFGLARASDKPRRNSPCTEKADNVALSRKPTQRAPG